MSATKKLRTSILMVASEVTPLAKVGGLGDVVGALPPALTNYVDRVTVAVPFYETIHQQHLSRLTLLTTINVLFCGKNIPVKIWHSIIPQSTVDLLLFDNALYLSQGDVYCNYKTWHPLHQRWSGYSASIIVRFAFLSQAVTAFLQRFPKRYNIIHLNDWLTAPISVTLQSHSATRHLKTVFTIHNPGHSLKLTAELLPLYPASVQHALRQDNLSFTQRNPLTRLGIRSSHLVNVVSPQYRTELLLPKYGKELTPLLQQRQANFYGILNGIDLKRFNPATDPALYKNFNATSLTRRLQNKLHLQQQAGFTVNPAIPLLGFVGRLESQKGLGLLFDLIRELPQLHVQCIITGTGKTNYEQRLQKLARSMPKHLSFHGVFDLSLSQQIYSGADIFLMPSLYEPCGLAQLIAMRYGCVPIVHAVGGLKDTVISNYNGFTFEAYSGLAFKNSLGQALTVYTQRPSDWKQLMLHGMAGNYNWKKSAQAYTELYKKLL